MFAVKTWGELASYDGYGGAVTGVKFGKSANSLVRIKRSVLFRTPQETGTAVREGSYAIPGKFMVFAVLVLSHFPPPKTCAREIVEIY